MPPLNVNFRIFKFEKNGFIKIEIARNCWIVTFSLFLKISLLKIL